MTDNTSRVALITDSMCDIPSPMLKQYNIQFVPLYLIWGTEEYRDQIDITPEEFYPRLAEEKELPQSSQTHPQDYVNLIEKARTQGAEEAVIISFSSHMSGSFKMAQQAAEMVDIPVHVYDSRAGGMSEGWQVLAAARAREAGGDAQAMLAEVDKVRKSLQFYFFVDTLENLYKGGRIDGISRFLGTLLQLKPMLYINHEVGRIDAAEKIRTRKRALERVYQTFFDKLNIQERLRIAVVHSGAKELAESVAERIKAEYQPLEIITTIIGPVMGTHIGPGAVGISGYADI